MGDNEAAQPMRIELMNVVKIVALIFFVWIALHFLGEISRLLLLLALVVLLAMIFTPPVSWAERHRVPRFLSAPLVILLFLSILGLLALWLLPALIDQVTTLVASIPVYWASIRGWLTDLTAQYPRVQELLTPSDQVISNLFARAQALLVQVGQFTIAILTGLAALVLVLVMTVFTLAKPRPLLKGLFAMVPEDRRQPVARALHTTAQQMRVYAWSSALVGLVNGFVAWLGLTFLGVEPALLLAALVFIGEFFPYIGPIAAAIPAVLLAFAVSPITALWVLLLFLGIQQLEASVLSPLILSRQMKFHPLSVTFAILALGELYGILGAFLAVPMLAAVKAFYTELVLKPRQVSEASVEACADVVIESHKPEKKKEDEGGPQFKAA